MRWSRIQQVFDRVMDAPAPERAAFLRRACSGDASLERDVAALVRHAQADTVAFDARLQLSIHRLAIDALVPERRAIQQAPASPGQRLDLQTAMGAQGGTLAEPAALVVALVHILRQLGPVHPLAVETARRLLSVEASIDDETARALRELLALADGRDSDAKQGK